MVCSARRLGTGDGLSNKGLTISALSLAEILKEAMYVIARPGSQLCSGFAGFCHNRIEVHELFLPCTKQLLRCTDRRH